MRDKRINRAFGRYVRAAQALSALLLPMNSLTALQPSHDITQYAHKAWTQQDGQLPGTVLSLTQRLDGSLWVGTEFGLFRFDGVTFSPWKPPPGQRLPSQVVTALAAARDGGLWIGTRSGLSYWKDAALKDYRTSEGVDGPSVSAVVVDHAGTVWVGTAGFNSGGLCRVEADRFDCLTPGDGHASKGVYALFDDGSGNLWFGGANGLYRWNSGLIRHHGSYGSSPIILGIAKAPDGSIIVSTNGKGGLLRLAEGRFVTYTTGQAGDDAHTRVLLSDHNGALWTGTTGAGLIHLHEGRIDRFTHADGLSGDTVLKLFEDREGNIWVATERGLDRFRDLPVTTLSKREGLSEDTAGSVFASRHGGVWIGTAKGLNRVVDGRIDTYDESNGLPSGSIGSLIEDHAGTLWVDTALGLANSRGGRFHRLDLPGTQRIRSVAAATEDREGVLWFSDLERGMIRVEAGEVKEVLPWSQFDNKQAWALDADLTRGGLLIGFAQGGVAHYGQGRPNHWYTTADGLGHGAVTDLHVDREGTAWIATQGGLSQLRNGRIETLTVKNGIPCDQIHAMVEDDSGALWLNTPCGLLRISRSDLVTWSADPGVKVQPGIYGAGDGMHLRSTTNGFFRGAVKSKDGRLWFPVFDGVAVVDPQHLPENRLPPPVEIGPILVDHRAYAPQPELRLPHIAKDLQIEYTAFSFVDPDKVRFRYKLDGYDADWNDVAGRRQAFYPSLPPRRYRFRVIASNNDGVWNTAGASLDFSVEPTFYQTIWFRLLCITVFATLLWALYRFRVRQLKGAISLRFEERLNERTRIARELHDTLLQNISGFALQLDGLSKVVTAPGSAKDRLRELRQQAEELLREARESVWDLRLQLSGEQDFLTVVRQIGGQITEGKGVQFRANVSGTRRTVPALLQQNLLRIIQEAVRNATRHASASEIEVDLLYIGQCDLCIHIRDNGCGFDLETACRKPGHWGLATMRERAQEIGAELKISTSPGRGVRIEIAVQVRADSDGREYD